MRRWIVRVALLLMIGAIINVAVAWAVVVAHGEVTTEWNPVLNNGNDPLVVFVTRKFGYENVVGCGRSGTLMCRNPEWVRDYGGTPWWPAGSVAPIERAYGIASGWPALSMLSWRSTTWTQNADSLEFHPWIHWGVLLDTGALDDPKGLDTTVPAVLPLRPLWPGFAINTLFYASVGWLLFAAPGVIRRAARRRGGRCVACGYDLRGSVSPKCPECGEARRS